jgi:hypothetical protein
MPHTNRNGFLPACCCPVENLAFSAILIIRRCKRYGREAVRKGMGGKINKFFQRVPEQPARAGGG